jgi:gamma-glutamylcyclotransferase (GGCT)/AIG2-like uncharacterized protein YtfP
MARQTLVFVYGSLRRGARHHDELAGATFVGESRTEPGYCLVRQGEYPALREGGTGAVAGELYLVSDELLARLDVFEHTPELYRRGEVRLEGALCAQAYFATS